MAVPASVRRFIIGTKGKTLQQIEQVSSTRINIPPRKDDEVLDEESDESVNLTIVGDVAGIKIAKAEIEKIVSEKVRARKHE
jgi:rRNA processing protein Krr1/Pno1